MTTMTEPIETGETGGDYVAADYREDWIDLRQQGYSYRQIGEEYGFSHEMVRQVIVSDPRVTGERPSTVRRRNLGKEITDYLTANGPMPRDELLVKFGMNNRQLTYLTTHEKEFPKHLIILARRDTSSFYTDDEIHDAMRRVWAEVQAARPNVDGLSHALYDQYRDVAVDPSPARIIGRYHTWNTACSDAGIPSGFTRRGRETYSTAWTDEEILAVIRRFVADMAAQSKRPTYGRFDHWQRDHADAPSGTTVRNRLKQTGLANWPDIIAAAMSGAGAGE